MPDADDFDIEELRALLRGEPPNPAEPAKGKPSAVPTKSAKPSPTRKPAAQSKAAARAPAKTPPRATKRRGG